MAPLKGLFDRTEESARAWVVDADGSRARLRQVELGTLEVEDHIEVRAGMLAGEKVILPPHDRLEDGRRVEVSNVAQ